jgi:P-type Ca2+ transporter type 2C
MSELSARAMRLLAVAVTETPIDAETNALPESLTLVGVFGMRDELRTTSYPRSRPPSRPASMSS